MCNCILPKFGICGSALLRNREDADVAKIDKPNGTILRFYRRRDDTEAVLALSRKADVSRPTLTEAMI